MTPDLHRLMAEILALTLLAVLVRAIVLLERHTRPHCSRCGRLTPDLTRQRWTHAADCPLKIKRS